MYVTHLSIREFRCIARADIEFRHPDSPDAEKLELPNVNLLTGMNGGGKSTVLKALVAATLGKRIQDTDFDATGWVRRGAKEDCRLQVGLLGHRTDEARPEVLYAGLEEVRPLRLATCIRRGKGRGKARGKERLERAHGDREAEKIFRSDTGPGFFLAAYGPSRHAARVGTDAARSWISGPRLQRVASMLDERVALMPLEEWLPATKESSRERFEEVSKLLGRLIPPTTLFLGEQEEGAYLFEQDGVSVPYGSLSEGLRSHIAWIADLLYHLVVATPPDLGLEEMPGVVLVDEVDQRLHPRWQLDLLAWLSAALPSLQFLVTSHSPLVAGGLRPVNIAVLEPHKDAEGANASRPRPIADDVFGRSADGVLTSSYFDLASTRADPFRKHLRELIARARAGDEDAPLQLMRVLGDPRKMKPVDAPQKGARRAKKGKGRGGSRR